MLCRGAPRAGCSTPHCGWRVRPFQSLHTAAPAGRRAKDVALRKAARSRGRQRACRCPVAAGAAGAAGASGEGLAGGAGDPPLLARVDAFLSAFWKFLRPHTIRGTILGSCAVTARALIECPLALDWGLLPRALLGVLALLCGNGFIVGINQVYDVDIDTVNKPFLPIAAGELSPAAAWALCLALAAGGLALTAANFGRAITGLYAFGLFLGTIYSVPPLRLKRFAIPAFMIIATVRGFLLNFGVYSAARAALGLPFRWNPAIVFITCFVTVFATVIAITKDLADVEGDKRFGIQTFATRLGVRNIAFLGAGLLAANYVGAVTAALRMPGAFNARLMVPAHLLLAAVLAAETTRLDRARHTPQAVAAFYRGVWNLFYAEYALLPFI